MNRDSTRDKKKEDLAVGGDNRDINKSAAAEQATSVRGSISVSFVSLTPMAIAPCCLPVKPHQRRRLGLVITSRLTDCHLLLPPAAAAAQQPQLSQHATASPRSVLVLTQFITPSYSHFRLFPEWCYCLL